MMKKCVPVAEAFRFRFGLTGITLPCGDGLGPSQGSTGTGIGCGGMVFHFHFLPFRSASFLPVPVFLDSGSGLRFRQIAHPEPEQFYTR